MNKILYISSEAYPLIKTGGLADVAGSLPIALQKNAQDIRLLIPAYKNVLKKIGKVKILATTHYYNQQVNLLEGKLPGSKIVIWLVDCQPAFNRPGGPYTDEHGNPWHDNALRFAIFCHTAVDIALNQLKLKWVPGIVHCNDWQTGLIPALLSLHTKRPATIFTIHNLAYQGIFEQQTFRDLHLPNELWHMHGMEFYGKFSFIKGGLVYADKITTVSCQYAKEILQAKFSYGLDGLLKSRKKDLVGIINGINDKLWNPSTDNLIEQKYNRRSLAKKSINKLALQKQFSLSVDKSIPMIGMISRLVEQKGLDIILEMLPKLLDLPVQLVILGTGETHYEIQLCEWFKKHPQQIHVTIGYNETLAHSIEAASDMYLMPSMFEPCGLNQLYSLRYGSLPIVTQVGGLVDTVINATSTNIANGVANGFMLKRQTTDELLNTIKQALTLYKKTKTWRQLQINAMSYDASWSTSAKHYINLYQLALDEQ